MITHQGPHGMRAVPPNAPPRRGRLPFRRVCAGLRRLVLPGLHLPLHLPLPPLPADPCHGCLHLLRLVVTNKSIGQAISGKGYKEYRLGDSSHWLQKRVGDRKNWRVIHGCLKEAKVCGRLEDDIGTKPSEFYRKNLSPIQSGCCKPPTYCGFTYANATYWIIPRSGLSSSNPDCKARSNDQDKLCYGCNACKGGVLATLENGWKKVVILNAALLAFVIVIYSVGCCAFRNNKSHSRHTHFYRGGDH
ncbi:unnamed protein product [Musa hybrid cultivar]